MKGSHQMPNYQAFQLAATDNATTATWITQAQPEPQLGWALVQVAYSDMNYKDALTTNPKSGAIHHYPNTPGSDAAGPILACPPGNFESGTAAVLIGCVVGVQQGGCCAAR